VPCVFGKREVGSSKYTQGQGCLELRANRGGEQRKGRKKGNLHEGKKEKKHDLSNAGRKAGLSKKHRDLPAKKKQGKTGRGNGGEGVPRKKFHWKSSACSTSRKKKEGGRGRTRARQRARFSQRKTGGGGREKEARGFLKGRKKKRGGSTHKMVRQKRKFDALIRRKWGSKMKKFIGRLKKGGGEKKGNRSFVCGEKDPALSTARQKKKEKKGVSVRERKEGKRGGFFES